VNHGGIVVHGDWGRKLRGRIYFTYAALPELAGNFVMGNGCVHHLANLMVYQGDGKCLPGVV